MCACPYRCTFCVLGKLCYLPTPGHPFPILQDAMQHSQEAASAPERAIWRTALLHPCLALLGVYHLMGAPGRVQDTVMLPVPTQNHKAGAWKHPSLPRHPGSSSLACLIASLFRRGFLMSLGYSAVTVTTAPAPHSLAFRLSRKSWC